MTNPYRALCAELADALAEWRLGGGPPEDTADADLIERARALLAEPEVAWEPMPLPGDAEGLAEVFWAEPEAVGPSADEWDALVKRAWDKYETVVYPGERFMYRFMYDSDFGNALDFVRRELARWGRPTPQPVAVSERLPKPEDCDAEGRCWLGGHQMGRGTPTWLLGYPAWAERFPDVHRFWLPANANALPTPEATND